MTRGQTLWSSWLGILILSSQLSGVAWDTVVFRDDFNAGKGSKHMPDPKVWVTNRPDSWWSTLGRTFFPSPIFHKNGPFPRVEDGVCTLEQHLFNPYDLADTPWTFLGGEIHTVMEFTPDTAYCFEARVRGNPYPNGLVTSFFTYGYDGTNSDEIDFEFLSNKTNDNATYPDSDPVLTNTWDESAQCPQFAFPESLDLSGWNTFRMYWYPSHSVIWTIIDSDGVERLLRLETNPSYIPDESMNLYFNFWSPTEAWGEAYDASLQPVDNKAQNVIYSYEIDHVEARALAGAPIYVPDDYDTIQGAIDAAQEGDTIVVAMGRYYENLNFKGKAITVTSLVPTNPNIVTNTIIDANDIDIGVAFWTSEESDSVLTGFTITNGTNSYGYGGGIYCSGASPTISYCVIENNSVQDSGGGMYLNSSDAIIEYCTIRNNTADHAGGVGIHEGYPIFRFCTFENNAGRTGKAGGIFYNGDGEVILSDCTFTGNTAQHGGGINIWRGTALIQRCLIQNNSATANGGGIYNFESETTVRLCTLRENTTYNGGAIFLQRSESEIQNCLLMGNEASNGGGIYTEESDAVVEACTVVGNRSNVFGGGGYLNYTSNIELRNNIFWINEAANQGDQIALGPSGNTYTTVSYCDVQGGQVLVSDLGAGTNALDWGEGNLDADPNFIAYGYWDPNGTAGDWTDDFWMQGDYRLGAESWCFNAGDPDYDADADDTDLAGYARIIRGIVDIGAYESTHPLLTKVTVKAGKTRAAHADSCSLSGSVPNLAGILENSQLVVIGVGPYAETIESNKFFQAGKKAKYTYKNSTDGFTAITFDFTKGIFSITGKNLDLSGMAAPVLLEIIIDDYYGLAMAENDGVEDVINGKKYLPMQLLQGQMDALRVDQVKAKASRDGSTVASLMVQGAIASAGNPDLTLSGLVIHWGAGQYPLAGAEFDRKAANKYIAKKKPEGLDQSSANVSLDFIKSTFKIMLKNTDLPWQDGLIVFGLMFDSYEEFREVAF